MCPHIFLWEKKSYEMGKKQENKKELFGEVFILVRSLEVVTLGLTLACPFSLVALCFSHFTKLLLH
jgi:hypothetical protein